MLVTVATLYNDSAAVNYVAVIEGTVSEEERHAMAERFDAEYGAKDEEEDGSYMYFREVETCAKAKDVLDMPNVDGTTPEV